MFSNDPSYQYPGTSVKQELRGFAGEKSNILQVFLQVLLLITVFEERLAVYNVFIIVGLVSIIYVNF